MKSLNQYTKKDFRKIRKKDWQEDIGEFDSIVIIPGHYKEIHDSGYRCMKYVLVKEGVPICISGGCSDVLHINGIGGYGDWDPKNGVPQLIKPVDWSIECLKKSGYLHMWCSHVLKNTVDLSSFDVVAIRNKRR